MAFEYLRFDGIGLTCVAVSLALAGCAGATAGGRPFVYKQGKGDAPSSISTQAGVVVKRESPQSAAGTAEPALTPAPAPAASSPAMVAAPAERATAQAAPAQAAPGAPSVASSSQVAAVEEARGSYTQATRYGDLLFVSGQIALDPASGGFDLTQDIQAQTRRVMQNILAILESHRLTMANVVHATVYLSSLTHFAGMNPVYHDFFKGAPPARSVVEVGRLPRGALVQIAVIAGR